MRAGKGTWAEGQGTSGPGRAACRGLPAGTLSPPGLAEREEEVEHTGVSANKATESKRAQRRPCVGKVGFLGRWVAASLGDSAPGLACCPRAPPRLEPRKALPGGPSVISCFESGSPGLTTLPVGSSLTGERALSVSSKLPPLGDPAASLPVTWGGQRGRGQLVSRDQGARRQQETCN